MERKRERKKEGRQKKGKKGKGREEVEERRGKPS